MQRFFFIALTVAGLVSCSSSSSETGVDPEPSGANQVTISKDGSNNPFAFSKEDIQRGADGRVTGEKRSQFEQQAESAYAEANDNLPAYLQKDFQKKTWRGSRDFRTGSYQTASYRESDQRSRFAGQRLREANKTARAAGEDFTTGSYRTGQANESGQIRPTGSSAYVDEQVADGWRKIQIIDDKEYRSITMDQAKSLLGR